MIGLLVLASIVAGPSNEASPSALSLTFEGCDAAEAKEIEDIVRSDVAWAPGDPSIVLTVQCQAAGVRLSLLVDDVPGQQRFVDLAQTAPEARLRLVALIATELVLVGRTAPPSIPLRRARDRAGSSSAGTDAPSPTPSSSTSASASMAYLAPARPLAILAVAGASLHGAAPGAALFELGGRFRADLSSTAGIALDLAGLYQRSRTASGTLMATGGDADLVAEVRARLAGGALRAALGGRVLVLRVSGSTSRPDVRSTAAWGATAGPVARLSASHEWERAVVEIAVAGGWTGPEAVGTVEGASRIGAGGWWGGLSLAAGWGLGAEGDRAAVSSAGDDR